MHGGYLGASQNKTNMKTHTCKRLFAGLFLGLAAVLWVGHATDSPANITSNSKVISTDHASIPATEVPFISLNTAAANSLTYEAVGTNVNKVVSSVDTAPMKTEGSAAVPAVIPSTAQDVNVNGTSIANGPNLAATAAVFAGTSLTPFSAAGYKEVPAPEIVGNA